MKRRTRYVQRAERQRVECRVGGRIREHVRECRGLQRIDRELRTGEEARPARTRAHTASRRELDWEIRQPRLREQRLPDRVERNRMKRNRSERGGREGDR